MRKSGLILHHVRKNVAKADKHPVAQASLTNGLGARVSCYHDGYCITACIPI